MFVIAFDGVLVHTLDARALALHDALTAEGVDVLIADARAAIAGRTFHEAVLVLAQPTRHDGQGARSVAALDATSIDIASLRATQAFASLASRGFEVNVHACNLLKRAAAVTRIVVRADSRRREVDALLALAGLDAIVSMSRCSDDPGARAQTGFADAQQTTESLHRSYAAIRHRLAANANFLGERGPVGIALESCEAAERIAKVHGFDVGQSLSTIRLPGLPPLPQRSS